MKKIIIALLLVGVFCFSLTACGDDDVESVLDDTDETVEEEQIEIPDAIKNLSPEDDKALTGVLTEDSYTNEYFGIKFNKVKGGTIKSLMDEGTDLTPLSETYENGNDSIMIRSATDDNEKSYSAMISALSANDLGKSEEDLIKSKEDFEKKVNEELESDTKCSVESLSIAGEEHPAYIEVRDDEGRNVKNATVFIVKGDFECLISINADVEEFDDILKLFEKI